MTRGVRPRPHGPASAEAESAGAGASPGPATAIAPAHGPSGKDATRAVDACLAPGAGGGGVVGVLARLATVDDPALSAVLAAQFRGMLAVVVVANGDVRSALVEQLRAARLPTPDVLAETHMQTYRPPAGRAGVPGWDGAGRAARRLTHAACAGTDDPLPIALPHARALGTREPPSGVPAAGDWPAGCCGYAFNLVRPAAPGARRGLLFALLGQTLVFETAEAAGAYREAVSGRLRAGCGDILTLDGGRITSKGIVSGSSFQVLPVGRAPFRFGTTPVDDRPMAADEEGGEEAAAAAALDRLADAMDAEAAAVRVAAQARRDADAAGERLGPELEEATTRAADLEARLRAAGGVAEGAEGPAGRVGRDAGLHDNLPAARSGGNKRTRLRAGGEDAGDENEPPAAAGGGGRRKKRRA